MTVGPDRMTPDPSKPQHRYVVLDSLRGVCACMVVLMHFGSDSHFYRLTLLHNGFLFVDFFFVLSGFVIATSYGSKLAGGFPIKTFMGLRFARIYPLHFFMLMIFLAFELAYALHGAVPGTRVPFVGNYSPESLIAELFLVQTFVGPDAVPWNGLSWSIAVEFWTYLLFALVARFANRLLVPLCLLTMIVAPLYLAVLTDRNIYVLHDGALVRCLFGFSAGVLGWKLAPRVQALQFSAWIDSLIEIGAVLLCAVTVSEAGAGRLSLATPCVFLIAVLVFSRQRGLVSKMLQLRPFVLLGTLSYSIYLTHIFLLMRFQNVLDFIQNHGGFRLIDSAGGGKAIGRGAILDDILTIVFMAGAITFAYLTYRFIEVPGQRLGRKYFGARKTPAPVAEVQRA